MSFTPQTFPAEGFSGASGEQQQIWWEEMADAVASHEASQDQLIADLQQITTDLAAVVADQAAVIADLQTVIRNDALSTSWTSPGSVLSAVDNGTNVTITIAAHTRYYGDGTSLVIPNPDTMTVAYGPVDRYVYYTDATRSDTTPNYQSTTNPNTAAPNRAIGRHALGKIPIPASGGAPTTGGTAPPGFGGDIGFGDIP